MRITPLDQIGNLPPGTNIEAVQGKILKIYEYKSGTNTKGAWSLQNISVQDATSKTTVVLKNRPELGGDWAGVTVVFIAGTNKNRPVGVMIDEYQEKIRVQVSDHATIEEAEASRQTQTRQPQQQQERPAQQTRQQQPAPQQTRQQAPQQRQQSLADEERQEQENARPDSQRTQQEPRQQQAPAQQQQRGGDRAEKTPEERLQNAKREMMKLVGLYVLSHDAAVLVASSIYSRHGHSMHPAGVGSLATTLFIEANKRNIGGPLPSFDPMKTTAPTYRLADIVAAFEEHQAGLAKPAAPADNDSTSPEALAEMPAKEW